MKRWAAVIIFASCFLCLHLWFLDNQQKPEIKINNTARDYQASIPTGENWWIQSNTGWTTEERRVLSDRVDSIKRILADYQNTNEQTKQIWEQASKSLWAVLAKDQKNFKFIQGGEFFGFDQGKPSVIMLLPADTVDDYFRKAKTVYAFDPNYNIVILPAREEPRTLLAATFYHEYGHSLQFNLEKKTVSGAEAEVPMHEIGISIVEHDCPRYKLKINEIIRRSRFENYKYAMAAITSADYKELDTLMLGQKYDRNQASTSATLHLLAVGFAFVEMYGGSKKEVYDFLINTNKH